MNSDRDGVRTAGETAGDERSDDGLLTEEESENTGQFTVDYTPPAWYSGGAGPEAAASPDQPEDAAPGDVVSGDTMQISPAAVRRAAGRSEADPEPDPAPEPGPAPEPERVEDAAPAAAPPPV
ncbi:SCO5717 family growth-regulating ATPase, partial [Streptomyces sp. SBT349]|uniref:SCO5717 family growth-regulating ATPase n=1 Tax=Streptomyces sp. SBT349 TaxID=1580539 RepID=UPI00066A17C3